jgi:hypothetical protein
VVKKQIKYLQNLFYELLNDYGQVYMVVKFSDKTIVGNRGFTEEEKAKGLVLIFNRQNHKNLQWTEEGSVIATLGFGTGNRLEKCFFYFGDIVSVFSPAAGVKFDIWNVAHDEGRPEISEEPATSVKGKARDQKIVSLDRFRKTKT